MQSNALAGWLVSSIAGLSFGAVACAPSAAKVLHDFSQNDLAAERPPVAGPPVELVLERALPIDVRDDFEPSGLAFLEGRLLTVSDKHDSSVFELVLHEAVAEVREFCRFEAPANEPRPFDFEAISASPDGRLLLASEARFRVLELDPQSRAAWKTASVQSKGLEQGLFQRRNAGLEGLARLPDGRLLLAAEREPRGLLEVSEDGSSARAWAVPQSAYPLPEGRPSDFSDLAVHEGRVYALERNAHRVVQLERAGERFRERDAWSYEKTENDPRFAYEDRSFGRAEGLAFDTSHVYIVLDNNGDAREAAASDRRALLFIFQRPGVGTAAPASIK